MAEGFARQLRGDVIEAYSAGVATHGMNPNAVKVMAEAGVDISGQRSKHVNELTSVPLDYVVTVCDSANESCPVFPGTTKKVHVGFDDPPRLAKEAKSEEEDAGSLPPGSGRNKSVHSDASARPHGWTVMRKYLAEAIGTFALVFAGTGAIIINDVRGGAITHVGIAMTFGLVVMTMIYALGDISGAHLNPAVTLGFLAARRFPLKQVLPYITSQFVAPSPQVAHCGPCSWSTQPSERQSPSAQAVDPSRLRSFSRQFLC